MDLAVLGLRVDSSQVKTATGDLDAFAKRGAAVEKSASGMSTAVAGLARAAVAAAAGLASLGALNQAIATARPFNAALAETSTLLNASRAEMDLLSKSAKELAATYGGTATAQVKAAYQAISAGAGGAAEAVQLLDRANRLAIGGVTDITTAVDGLTTATNAYSATGLTAQQASDAMFVAMRAGKTTVGELSSQLGQIVPIASSVGVTFDEVVGGIAALTTQGQSTSMATTGLRAALSAVIAPAAQARDVAEQLGLAFNVQSLQAKGLAGFLEDVIEKTGGNQEAMAELFGSVEALNAVLAFAGGAGNTFSEIMEDMADKAGATDEAFTKIADSLDERMNIALGQIGVLGLEIGERLLAVMVPALEAAATVATLVADNLDRLVAVGAVLATAFAARLAVSVGTTFVAAAVQAIRQTIALEMALGATSRSAAVAGASIKLFSGALRAMRAALISTGIGALVVIAGELLYQFSNLVRATGGFGAAMKSLGEVGIAVWDGIVTSASAIPAGLASIWNTVRAGFYSLVADLQRGWLVFLNTISQGLASIGALEASSAVAQRIEAPGGVGPALDKSLAKVDEFSAAADSARERAAGLANEGLSQITAAASRLSQTVVETASSIDEGAASAEEFSGTLDGSAGGGGGGGGLSGAAKEAAKQAEALREEIEQLEFDADPVKKYTAEVAKLDKLLEAGLSQGAYDKAVEKLNDELASSLPLVDDLTGAFSNFLQSGLKDFEGFVSSIWQSFTSLIGDMIATALRNRILIPIAAGFSGGAGIAGTALQAAGGVAGGGGGILGGLLGSFGTAGAAGSGFLGGLGAAFSGGIGNIFNIGANAAAAGGGFAATLGAAVPILGAAALVVGLFSKKTKELDRGLQITIDGMDAFVETFRKVETSRFFGLSKSRSTQRDPADAETTNAIQSAVNRIGESVMSLAETLNLATDAINDVQFGFDISTKGLSDEQVQAEIEKKLAELGDEFANAVVGTFTEVVLRDGSEAAIRAQLESLRNQGAPANYDGGYDWRRRRDQQISELEGYLAAIEDGNIRALEGAARPSVFGVSGSRYTDSIERVNEEFAALQKEGEGTYDTLQRIVTNLVSVNEVMDTLGHALYAMSLQGAGAASGLVDAFGSLEAFNAATTTYFDAFYTEAEKTEIATRKATEALAEVNAVMPRTRAEYRAMVEAADLSTESGRDLYATLLTLAGVMDQVLPSVEQFSAEVQALAGGITSGMGELIQGVFAVQRENERAAQEWYRASETLRDLITRMRGTASAFISAQAARGFNESRFQSLLESAVSGDVEAASNLPDAARALLDATRATARTREELARVEARVLSDLQLASGVADIEGVRHDVIVALLEQQIGVMEEVAAYVASGQELSAAQIEAFEAQLGALGQAIDAVDSISYADIRARLDVMLNVSDTMEPWLRTALSNATGGLEATVDFIVRDQSLTPELRWLALTGASEHLKTLEFVVSKPLDAATKKIAIDTVSSLRKTIDLVAGADISTELKRIALAGSSELARVVNVALASGADQQAIRLALSNTSTYAVAVHAALTASDEIRKIVFTDSGSFAAMIEAAFTRDVDPRLRRVLLERQGIYAMSVVSTLRSDTTNAMKTLLLNSNTTAIRGITLAMAFAETLTDRERYLLLTSSIQSLYTIRAAVNSSSFTSTDTTFLDQIRRGNGSISRTIAGRIDLSALDGRGLSLLDMFRGASAGKVTLSGGVVFDPSSAFEQSVTQNMRNPMIWLRDKLEQLRQAVIADTAERERAARIADLQAQLGAALGQRGDVLARAGNIITQIQNLERSTGVDIRNNGGDAVMRLNSDGTISYAATHVDYGGGANINGFRNVYWSDGGLEDQLLNMQNQANVRNTQMDRLRDQIRGLGAVPAFAAGGLHTGGMRLVGERGPELEVTGPARYYSAPETSRMLASTSSEELAELRALRAAILQMSDEQRQLGIQQVMHGKRQADVLTKFDKLGAPVRNPDDGTPLETLSA